MTFMPIFLRVVLIGAMPVLLLTACADNQVSYGNSCMTCFDNPMTGKPLNYDPTQYSNKGVTSNGTGNGTLTTLSAPQTLAQDSVTISFGRDVDTAALRIKEAFGFMTKDEAVAEMGNAGKMMFSGPGYAYRATPGSMYLMKTQAYSGDLTATVTKQGNGAQVVMKYAQKQNGGMPIASVMQQVKDKTEKALQ